MNKHRAEDIALTLLRVVSGFVFVCTGGLILFGWFGGMPGGMKLDLMSQTGIGGLIEFFGGVAMALGLATRPVAFILSGTMAVAYWQFHAPKSIWPVLNDGQPAMLLCFIFLFFAVRGAGPWSLDALLSRPKPGAVPAPSPAA